MTKALIAMSGGVDSGVAACLMKDQGFSCIGVTMKLFQNEDIGLSKEHSCCSLDDVEDARSVARRLSMPHYVFNFSDRFRECVIDKFIGAYESGVTPNPCIDCNRYLKFDKLFLRAKELGCGYVVTGHYARIDRDDNSGRFLLKKGVDREKDQSYVLFSMTQEQLAHTRFPLGALTKTEVRRIAAEHGFINAEKPESQDICFVVKGRYADFIEEQTGRKYPEGDFVDADGRPIGRHRGIIHYTVGQRKGLGIAAGVPLYVSKIDPIRNTVVLGTEETLYTSKILVKDINMISVPVLKEPKRFTVMTRYRGKETSAVVRQIDEDTLEIVFDTPQKAVAKGQAAVVYDGDIVVGGGTIAETEPASLKRGTFKNA